MKKMDSIHIDIFMRQQIKEKSRWASSFQLDLHSNMVCFESFPLVKNKIDKGLGGKWFFFNSSETNFYSVYITITVYLYQ